MKIKYFFFKQTEMTKYRLTELFARLSEKANLFKQYAQRTVLRIPHHITTPP